VAFPQPGRAGRVTVRQRVNGHGVRSRTKRGLTALGTAGRTRAAPPLAGPLSRSKPEGREFVRRRDAMAGVTRRLALIETPVRFLERPFAPKDD
jgi:hypothetical protein